MLQRILSYIPKRLVSIFPDIKHIDQMAVPVSIKHPDSEKLAINLLQKGQVIAVPTDTIYGLACSATNSNAINMLYDIKERNKLKPLAICLGRISDIQKWAHIEHLPQNLLSELLPGPVTLILQMKNTNLDSSLHLNGKVGIRIPDCDFIRNMVNGLKSPIALTSANLSGEPSSTKIIEFEPLWSRVACVFDGGILGNDSIDSASTIVDLSWPDVYKIVRGGVAEERTCCVLDGFNLRHKTNLE